jgi:hypothetical protein
LVCFFSKSRSKGFWSAFSQKAGVKVFGLLFQRSAEAGVKVFGLLFQRSAEAGVS